jgi:cell division protein FtsQ
MSPRTTARAPAGPQAGTSVPRLEDRIRHGRRGRRRRLLGVLLGGLLLAGLVGGLLAGPVLVVREIRFVGAGRALESQMRLIAQGQVGTPLARVDVPALTSRLGRFETVASVRVERSWPSTLRVVVRRRTAVAVRRVGSALRAVDATGRDFATVRSAPAGLAVIAVPDGSAGRAPLRSALTVLGSLPPDLRGRVRQVRADTPDDVRLTLGPDQVVWGGTEDAGLKARVLRTLLRQPAAVYDVSSPRTPVLR